jgi:predicted transcriptional regulator
MKQSDVADLLGITQAAVSKYNRQIRGATIKIDQIREIQVLMQEISKQLAEKRLSSPQLSIKICEVCKVVRQEGLMCLLCKRSDPALDIEKCHVCKSKKQRVETDTNNFSS